jgi:hypothetical protein
MSKPAVMYEDRKTHILLVRGRYNWVVFNNNGNVVFEDWANSFSEAFRNARNYIRHHQNEVFS